jgi:hypothetical protein
VRRVQVSDAVVLAEAKGTDLDDRLHTCRICSWHNLGATLTYITLPGVAEVELLVDTSDNQIKDGNDVSGVVFELLVQLKLIGEQVLAVDVKDVLLSVVNLSEFLHIIWLLFEILGILGAHEVSEEITKPVLHLRRVDICAIENLGVGRWLVEVSKPLHSRRGPRVDRRLIENVRVVEVGDSPIQVAPLPVVLRHLILRVQHTILKVSNQVSLKSFLTSERVHEGWRLH